MLSVLKERAKNGSASVKRTSTLTLALIYYFLKKKYSCYTEFGLNHWGKRRADFIAINHKSQIIIAEVKQSINDFRNDNKWETYLEYCNGFYFCFPHDLWHKYRDEIKDKLRSKPVGVAILDSNGRIKIVRSTKWRTINGNTTNNIVLRMAWRGGESARTSRSYKVYL